MNHLHVLLRRCSLAALFSVALVVQSAQCLALDVVDVEGQPLAANAKRLVDALRFLWTPLPASVVQELDQAGR